MESSYAQDVRLALAPLLAAGRATIAANATEIFSTLARSFPTSGSKIDLASVPRALRAEATSDDASFNECLQFWERVVLSENLSSFVTYACDGELDFSVDTTVPNVGSVLRCVLEVPQHHYLVGAGGAWCMCFTMEGDMDFGWSPKFRGPN